MALEVQGTGDGHDPSPGTAALRLVLLRLLTARAAHQPSIGERTVWHESHEAVMRQRKAQRHSRP